MLQNIPPELIIFLASAVPLTEINGSIPLGHYFGMSASAAFFWSLLGNTLAAVIVLKILDPVMKFIIKKISILDRHFEKVFNKMHRKHSKRFNDLGTIFLAIFVALPLPGSGTYSGSLAAYLFNIPFWPAILAILAGNLIKGLLLTGGVETLLLLFQFA